MEKFPSKTLEKAVDIFSTLPGVGKKTALRYVLHLLKGDAADLQNFSEVLMQLKNNFTHCNTCYNVSDTEQCHVCANPQRNHSLVCVVQDIRDVLAIESTGQYTGVYHVLGGLISPMDGIAPGDLKIQELVQRIQAGQITEIIMALSATMEGDTTNFFIYKKLKDVSVKISTIARGIGVGDELEYTDELTLARSIVNRVPYENTLVR